MENGIERIRSGIELLRPAEKNVAFYILEHLEDVIRMPIAELAVKAKTSEATIIRMCRALSFSGYKDLKLSIATASSINIQQNYNFELEKGSSLLQMVQTIEMHNIEAIQRTLMVNDIREYEKSIIALNRTLEVIKRFSR